MRKSWGILALLAGIGCGDDSAVPADGGPDALGDAPVDARPDAPVVDSGCALGQLSCDGGCVDPSNDLYNCGGCGNVCDDVESIDPTCVNAKCHYNGCGTGFADCDTSGSDVDGCETSTGSTTDCSACGIACDQVHSTGASCSGTTCQYTGCMTGFADCDFTPPNANGCETATTTITNCSGCGVICDSTHSTGASCDGTTCNYTGCQAGFADCDSAAPNADGCETPTTTTSNCGGCGNVCTLTNASAALCTGSRCAYTCQTGFSDCNADIGFNTDGCECAGTICCSGGCAPAHSNGLTGTYYDCSLLGTPGDAATYNLTMAQRAAGAWMPGSTVGFACGASTCLTKTAGGQCATWCYGGALAGNAHLSTDTTCGCPVAGVDPTWN